MEFEGPKTLAIALVVSLLVGTVMGAIPGGGMIGEMLIVSLYGFPPEALPIIAKNQYNHRSSCNDVKRNSR